MTVAANPSAPAPACDMTFCITVPNCCKRLFTLRLKPKMGRSGPGRSRLQICHQRFEQNEQRFERGNHPRHEDHGRYDQGQNDQQVDGNDRGGAAPTGTLLHPTDRLVENKSQEQGDNRRLDHHPECVQEKHGCETENRRDHDLCGCTPTIGTHITKKRVQCGVRVGVLQCVDVSIILSPELQSRLSEDE